MPKTVRKPAASSSMRKPVASTQNQATKKKPAVKDNPKASFLNIYV